ncbi:hypothetical protein Tco_0550160 [Tanacetum coccineum]
MCLHLVEDGERVICDQELVTWKLMSPSSQRMMLFQEEKEQSLLLTTSLKLKIVMLEKLVSTDEQRLQQKEIMTQLVIEKEVNKDRGFMLRKLESMRQEMLASRGQGSNDAQDGEYEYFLDTDSVATLSSSWSSDNDNYDDEDSDMEIDDDDYEEGDDNASGFAVFFHDKTKELPKFTPINPIVTCSSLEDYIMILNDQPDNELTNLMCRPVFTDTQTTFVVTNPEGNPKATMKKFKEYDQKLEALSKINVPEAIKEFVQAKVMLEMNKQLPKHVPNVVVDFIKPCLDKTVLNVIKTNQIKLFTTPSTEMELNIKLYNRMYQIQPNFMKRPYDDQDPPNNCKGENNRRRRKDAGEYSSKSSKKYKAPIDSTRDDIPADQPLMVTKKVKELIKKDKLTIADLEGASLEMLKSRYKNYMELEYHIEQMKSAMSDEAKWSDGEDDLTKPRYLEKKMSKSAKPDSHFYNSDFYYLAYISVEKMYTLSLTKHYAATYYVEGIEDMISDR